jgi:hypothetical protein
MSDWTQKDKSHPDHPMRDPASAANYSPSFARPIRSRHCATWVPGSRGQDIPGDQRVRGDILALIREAGDMRVRLPAQFVARQSDQLAARGRIGTPSTIAKAHRRAV